MDRDELLGSLRSLESSIPNDGIETEDRAKLSQKALEQHIKFYDMTIDDDFGTTKMDADTDAVYKRNEMEMNKLVEEKEQVEDSLSRAEGEYRRLEEEIKDTEERRKSFFSQKFSQYESILKRFDDSISVASNEEKEALIKLREKREKELNDYRERKKKSGETLEERKQRLAKLRSLIDQKRTVVENLTSEIKIVDERIESLRNAQKLSPEAREQLELDTEALYYMHRYFSLNPKEELNDIISSFERGEITQEVVNERLRDVKSLLTSKAYDVSAVNVEYTPEELLRRTEPIKQRIAELEERVANDENYKIETSDYKRKKDIIWGYDVIMDDIISRQKQLKSQEEARIEAISRNESQIEEYNNSITSSENEIERIKTSGLSESVKTRKIRALATDIYEYGRSIKALNAENGRLESHKEDYSVAMDALDSKYKKYEDESKKLKEELYFIDEFDREKDLKELEEQRVLLQVQETRGGILNTPFLRELDNLIGLTGGKAAFIDADEKLPPFVRNFPPEQRKLYEDLMGDLTPEERKDVDDEIEKYIPVDPDKQLAIYDPNNKEISPIPLKPPTPIEPTKVSEFKATPRELLDKAKNWFKRNCIKVVAVTTLIMQLANLALIIYKKITPSSPAVTQTVTIGLKEEHPAAGKVMTPPETAKENAEPEVEAEVEADKTKKEPTHKNDKNDPTPTPTPTTPPAEEQSRGENDYVLYNKQPEGTGDSAYADPNVARIEGESVSYTDPQTGTRAIIGADGRRVIVYPDGTTRVDYDYQQTTSVDADHDLVKDPDFGNIPEQKSETPPETAKTVEEAVSQGIITDAEAQKAQDLLDSLFAEIGQEQSLGGR